MVETRTFQLNKLVHDGIVQSNINEGGSVDFEVLEGEALREALKHKLKEEQRELKKAKSDRAIRKEQEDVNNVLFALGELASDSFRPTKTFEEGHFIHTVTLPADNIWADYYASEPERFPEITLDV